MRKKPEYKIIWVTPPDPVKLGTIMGEIYARNRGLEFVGLVPNGKDSRWGYVDIPDDDEEDE